jgi:hypothetical protein
MQTIDNIRTNLDYRLAYIGKFQMAPTPVAPFALVVARAPAIAVVVAPRPTPEPRPPPQPPAIVEGSETTGHLQRARKIPDYRSAYIGNFQMAPRTLGVEGSGAMDVYSNKS